MARKPNYDFERAARTKAKAAKREAKRQAKQAAKEKKAGATASKDTADTGAAGGGSEESDRTADG
jgi:hypothetical protein